MMSWTDVAELLTAFSSGGELDPRVPDHQVRLYTALVEQAPTGEPDALLRSRIAGALTAVDRDWLVGLGEDPARSMREMDAALSACERLRRDASASLMPLRYARVELCSVYGEPADALDRLREARLFSFGEVDEGAALAAARMHDDYSGVIRTTSAVPGRQEADPVGIARALAACLLPYLAQGRHLEAEDALLSLQLMDVPASLRLRLLGDQLEYLGLAGQWARGMALLRHTDLSPDRASAWSLLNAAVGLSLLLREANRAGHGSAALGSSLTWKTPWAPELRITAWDTMARGYDMITGFARQVASRFDARNGNNGVSVRVETRMAGERRSLATRSYGTVIGGAVDSARVRNRGALLAEMRELLVLASGYGLASVHERALSTAETVSQSLSMVTDDAQLELVVDMRIAFSRLLLALGASERCERESLDTAELCLSQGWQELAVASLAVAAQGAEARGATSNAESCWNRVGAEATTWGIGRLGDRLTVLTDAIGDPATSARTLVLIAEACARGVEGDPSRASAARETCKRARIELDRSRVVPDGVAPRVEAVEAAMAPYGRGRGGRRRPGSARTVEPGGGRHVADSPVDGSSARSVG